MSLPVLVTGADGFIGRHLVAALEASGSVVLRHTRANGDIAHSSLNQGDVGHVFHLAGRSFVPHSWENPFSFYDTNVMGTVNVLELCRKSGAGMTLVSSYVYGRPQTLPIPEEHPVFPFNPYAHSKILAEETARFYQTEFHVPVTIVRPANVYGPGQPGTFLIPTLVRQALDSSTNEVVVKDERPRRDYVFVADLVELLLLLLDRPYSGILNAGSSYSVSISQLASVIANILGETKTLVSLNESRPGEVFDVYLDCSRAKRELGWTARTTLEEGLRAVIARIKQSE